MLCPCFEFVSFVQRLVRCFARGLCIFPALHCAVCNAGYCYCSNSVNILNTPYSVCYGACVPPSPAGPGDPENRLKLAVYIYDLRAAPVAERNKNGGNKNADTSGTRETNRGGEGQGQKEDRMQAAVATSQGVQRCSQSAMP